MITQIVFSNFCGKINLLGGGKQKVFQSAAVALTTTDIRVSKRFNSRKVFIVPDRQD